MFEPAAGPVIDYLTMVQSSQLESSSCGQFCLYMDKWIGYGLWSFFELVGDRRLCTCSESVCHCGM